MRKIETTDSRFAVIQKFEDTMEYLKSQSSATVTEMERILQSDESREKIANLLLNFQLDVLMIASNTSIYAKKIKNSVLNGHREYHEILYKDLDTRLFSDLHRMQRVLDSDPILKLSAPVFTSIQDSLLEVMRLIKVLCVPRTSQEIIQSFDEAQQAYQDSEFGQQQTSLYISNVKRSYFSIKPATIAELEGVKREIIRDIQRLSKFASAYEILYYDKELMAKRIEQQQIEDPAELDLFFYDLLRLAQIDQWIATLQENKTPSHFPVHLTYDLGINLFNFLKTKPQNCDTAFIAEDTDSASFMYYMGCSDKRPADLHNIVWIAQQSNKQLLRELLEHELKSVFGKTFSKRQMEQTVPHVFVDTNGEPMNLAKNKPVNSFFKDEIDSFYKKSSDLD